MAGQKNYKNLVKTKTYKEAVSYLKDIGYSDRQAKQMIKEYVFSDNYVNLTEFIKNFIPMHRKLGGAIKGKRFKANDWTTTFRE